MLLAEFEHAVPKSELPQTHASDREATRTDMKVSEIKTKELFLMLTHDDGPRGRNMLHV